MVVYWNNVISASLPGHGHIYFTAVFLSDFDFRYIFNGGPVYGCKIWGQNANTHIKRILVLRNKPLTKITASAKPFCANLLTLFELPLCANLLYKNVKNGKATGLHGIGILEYSRQPFMYIYRKLLRISPPEYKPT